MDTTLPIPTVSAPLVVTAPSTGGAAAAKPPTLSLNKPKLDNLAGDIWKSAERLRGKFKPYEYQGVILPIIVIRRLECVLLAWREAKSAEVLDKRPGLRDKPKDLDK